MDCDQLLAMLIGAVRRLAAPATEQNEYIATIGFHFDELALELDDVRLATVQNCRLSQAQISALECLDKQLGLMSGFEHEELWAAAAVSTAPEWQEVRRLASRTLALLEGQSPA